MNEKQIELEETILDIISRTKEKKHGLETKKWLLLLEPKADWEIQIAALAHDIERAVPYIENMTPVKPWKVEKVEYYEKKSQHAKRSADIVKHIMREMNFAQEEVKRVISAIKKHETGGDTDSDLVRDADSVRFFDTGIVKYAKYFSEDSAKIKAKWMYSRASDKAQRMIKTLNLPFRVDL